MDKIAAWRGMTESHGFRVEVYRDATVGVFVAQIQTSSPALIPQHIPGTPISMMEFDDPEELKHKELNHLREIAKQRIASRCGKILHFSENDAL